MAIYGRQQASMFKPKEGRDGTAAKKDPNPCPSALRGLTGQEVAPL